jgi:prepilin-type N-terminal cleavage/methylation domain-containing protein
MTRIQQPKRIEGFTLMEVVISIALLAIVMTSVVGVMVKGRQASAKADYVYTAYNIAKNHIETLRAMSFAELSLANETDTLVNGDGVPDPEGMYKRTTTITANYSGNANLAKVDVLTTYTFQGASPAQPIQLTTVVYNG